MFEKKLKRSIWLIVLVAMLASALPYAIGFMVRPAGYSLLGDTPVSFGDAAVYYSYIEQGRQGHWLMADVFTSEPYRATIWEPLWFVIGQVANIFHLSTPWAYAVARTAAIPLLVFALWWMASWLWPDGKHQRTALWLTIFGGGVGGLVMLIAPHFVDHFGFVAIDQWVSEAFVNLSMMASVHFILTLTGTIFVLGLVERSNETQHWRPILWAAVIATLTLIIHPFLVITWVLVWCGVSFGQWLVSGKIPWKYVLRWGSVVVACVPVVAFYAIQLTTDPLSAFRAAQNINITPSYAHVVLGLGLFLPLGLWGWWLKGHDRRWNFLAAWAMAIVVAMYLPISFNRRLSEGLIIPWAFLSLGPLVLLWDTMKKKGVIPMALTVVVVGVLLFSTWPTVVWTFPRDYKNEIAGRPGHVYFLSPDFQALEKYLKTTESTRPLLASLHDSNILAGLTAHHVFFGHPVETADYQKKAVLIDNFFATNTDQQRLDFLMTNNICYIVDGPQERAIGPSWHPGQQATLHLAWSSPTIRLYQTPTCQ